MVKLIEDLALLKEYKVETLYLAVSLADRYLVHIAVAGQQAPCLITLSVVCLLMAAKLGQPISPSFTRMIALLHEHHDTKIEKQAMKDLEEAVLRALDFSLQYSSPVPFLERYLRVFGLDIGRDAATKYITKLARNFCRYMQRDSSFLDF